jgi:hypothetical protein
MWLRAAGNGPDVAVTQAVMPMSRLGIYSSTASASQAAFASSKECLNHCDRKSKAAYINLMITAGRYLSPLPSTGYWLQAKLTLEDAERNKRQFQQSSRRCTATVTMDAAFALHLPTMQACPSGWLSGRLSAAGPDGTGHLRYLTQSLHSHLKGASEMITRRAPEQPSKPVLGPPNSEKLCSYRPFLFKH